MNRSELWLYIVIIVLGGFMVGLLNVCTSEAPKPGGLIIAPPG